MRLRLSEMDARTLYESYAHGRFVEVPKELVQRWRKARKEYSAAEEEIQKLYDVVERRYWARQARKTKGHPASECPNGGYCGECFLETSIVDGEEVC